MVAKMNEHLHFKLAPEDVKDLMKTPEFDVQASTNRLRDHQEKFQNSSREMRVARTCETDGFMRKISLGQYFRTIYDVQGGFGGRTGAC